MNLQDIEARLERIAGSGYFERAAYQLVDEWTAASVGVEAVEPILRFMERYPDVDLGTPGPLVHFVEQFCGKGYEVRLYA